MYKRWSWVGYDEDLDDYTAWKYRLVGNAKKRSRQSGLDFDLSIEDFEIPEVCPVLGIKLITGREGEQDHCASLDRIDNSKGYTKDNVRVISFRANTLKRDSTLDELKAIIEYMEGRPRF